MSDSSLPLAEKKFIEIKGRRMAYIGEGEGAPIVFQHGNPTSSYLWRNAMPACGRLGRLIACDLIGMGDSDKLPNSGPDRYTWPRQIPLDGEPAEVVKVVTEFGNWLRQSQVPKLWIHGDPGAIETPNVRSFCRTWPNQTEVTVKGVHFLQEDSPTEIGAALADFVRRLRSVSEGSSLCRLS